MAKWKTTPVIIDQTFGQDGIQIRKSSEHNIQLFPNPVASELTLQLANKSVRQFEIYSISGQRIYSQAGNTEQMKYQINVQNWAKGMYYLRLYLADGTTTNKRFIVEKN